MGEPRREAAGHGEHVRDALARDPGHRAGRGELSRVACCSNGSGQGATEDRLSVLTIEGVTRVLDGRELVTAASLAIDEGESVALLGPSGSGKTTLLQIIGLIDRPDAGTVTIDGYNAWTGSDAIRAELRLTRIGFVLQQDNLIEHMTARENVALPAWRVGGSRDKAMQAADRELERVGLA